MLPCPTATRRVAKTLFVGLTLQLAAFGFADEPLVWKWSDGETNRYHLAQEMRMTMQAGPVGRVETSSRTDTLMAWTADGVTENGDARLRQSTERVVMRNDGPMGQGFVYDSDAEDPPAGMATLVAPMFRAMCDNDFELTMAPSGKISDVELSEGLAAAFDKLPGGAVSSEMVKQTTEQFAMAFPERPLQVGDEWSGSIEMNSPPLGPMRTTTTYRYEGAREVEGRELETFTPEVKIESLGDPTSPAKVTIATKSSDGEIFFDREAGCLVRSKLHQVMAVTVKLGEQSITNEVEQTVEMRRLADGDTPRLGAADAEEDSMAAEAEPSDEQPAAPPN